MASASDSHEDRQTGNVSDPYQDLLSELAEGPRRGFVQRLATGYYEGWRPTRAQVANLIARESGRISEDEYLAVLRGTGAPSESRQNPSDNDPHRPIPDQPSPPKIVAQDRATLVEGSRGPQVAPSKVPVFTVACGELIPRWDFIARGLIGGAWVNRGGRMFRLMSLQYELIPRRSFLAEPARPRAFAAFITCLPDSPAPREPVDGTSVSHAVRAGRVIGVRGRWPIAADVRQIRFLIYPQQPPSDGSERHPAGALWVDLTSGQAHWRPVRDRRVDRDLPVARQLMLREG